MSDINSSEVYNLINNTTPGYYYSGGDGATTWLLLSFVLAVIGSILVYFLFIKNPEAPKGKFTKWLKDFLSFKIMWIEPILKVLYYFATIFIICFSFSFLSLGGAGILVFFLILIFGPIAVRLIYEVSLMFVMIWHNTRDIAENTKKK